MPFNKSETKKKLLKMKNMNAEIKNSVKEEEHVVEEISQ